jgi:hypothetical protein
MPPKKRKIPPHPSGMAQPPMSKANTAYEKRREVAKKFFDSAEARGDFTTPSIRGALDKVPKTASVGLSGKGELLINYHSREEFHAHGCPIEFRHEDESWTVDGCVRKGDDEGGLYFEGTLIENTVKGENGGRKCDIEFYHFGKTKTIEMERKFSKQNIQRRIFTLTNFMRKGVTTKEKVSDFIMWEDHEQLKLEIIEEVFLYYS